MVSETDKAYTAGIIDGEGYIGISYDRKRWHIRERVDVHMKYATIPRWLKKTWGGFIMKVDDGYIWRVGAIETRILCKEILPYMVLKRRQARVILQLQKVKEKRRPGENDTPEIKDKKHQLYTRLKGMHN